MRRAELNASLVGARALVVFVGANLLGLFPDVWLAHTSFWHSRAEWIPLCVSALAGVATMLVAWLGITRATRFVADLIALACVATGVAGLVLHLGSGALVQPSLKRLVYSAPILAPAAYAGLGLLLAVAVHVDDASRRGRAAMLLAGLGLFGNFALCLLDHAQNGFWAPIEWASVAAAALGGVTITAASILELRDGEKRLVWLVLGLMLLTALVGSALHVTADLRASGPSLLDRLRYGAPVFAPALFADLALLAALGMIARAAPSTAARG